MNTNEGNFYVSLAQTLIRFGQNNEKERFE